MSRSGVRVTGGAFRGRVLSVPRGVRPTVGLVREALFSIWRERLPGARFLDLFAGSGAVAVEAASRGAARVTTVEEDPAVIKVQTMNLERTGAQVTVRRGRLPADLVRAAGGDGPFDLIFADPPYGFPGHFALLAALAPLLAAGGEVAVEHGERDRLPGEVAGLRAGDRRKYGGSVLTVFRRAAEVP